MTVATDTVLKAIFEMAFPDNSIAQIVFWLLTDFTTSQEDNTVADAVEEFIENVIIPFDDWIKSTCSVNQSEVNEMTWNATTEQWETSRLVGIIEPDITFAETGELLPFQSCLTMVGNTARPKSRGRNSIPGLTEIAQAATVAVPSLLTSAAVALANYLADDTISSGNDLITGVASTVTGTFLPFTDGEVNDVFGTQRRRKPGVGA